MSTGGPERWRSASIGRARPSRAGSAGRPTSRPRRGRSRCGRFPDRPTCCSSFWTTPGSGSSAVTAARSRRRIWTRSRPAGCATTACTPRRCARRRRSCIDHRPQPPHQRDGRDHRAGDRLSGLQRQHPVRERVPVGDAAAARLQHLHGRQVASDAVRAGVRRRARTTGGRWGAASSASTGSSAATPASGIRSWSTTTTRSSRRVARRRATT